MMLEYPANQPIQRGKSIWVTRLPLHSKSSIPLFTTAVGSVKMFLTPSASERLHDAWDRPCAGPDDERQTRPFLQSPCFSSPQGTGETLDRSSNPRASFPPNPRFSSLLLSNGGAPLSPAWRRTGDRTQAGFRAAAPAAAHGTLGRRDLLPRRRRPPHASSCWRRAAGEQTGPDGTAAVVDERRHRRSRFRRRAPAAPVASFHLPAAVGGAEKGNEPRELTTRVQLVHQRQRRHARRPCPSFSAPSRLRQESEFLLPFFVSRRLDAGTVLVFLSLWATA
jgi:hypothetical protein